MGFRVFHGSVSPVLSGQLLRIGLAIALCAIPARADGARVEFRPGSGRLEITVDGAPAGTYVYRDAAIPRPYFAHLHAPGGVRVTRNHPPVAGADPGDHAALHPGLWLAFGDLSGADSWRNKAPVEHEGFVEPPTGGDGRGSFAVRNAYRPAPGKPPYAREVCRIAVVVRPAGYLLVLRSEFTPLGQDLVFGDQEEMGLGVRVATPLSVKKGGRILDAEGHRDEREVRGKASDWCDYGGASGGRWAGVTLMPDPSNFRRSWFHARDYGLIVANPFGRKALTKGPESRVIVRPGEALRLGFGVLLHSAPAASPTDPRSAYRDYLDELARPAARVDRVQRAPSPSAVADLGGFVGRRVRANRDGYLKPFDIDRYVRMVEGRRYRDWNWIGEQPGKWLESAAWAGRQAGDRDLEAKARAVLARLERAQEPSGYLGITDPAVRTPEKPLRGMDAYELTFLLHALITASQEWDDPAALETARRLAGYLVDHVGPGKAEFWPSPYRPPANRNLVLGRRAIGVPAGSPRAPKPLLHSDIAGHAIHYGWEGTLLIDPVLRLYGLTGDARLLDWSRWAAAGLDRWSGWDAFSKLDRVADGQIGLPQLQPYAHVHTLQMNFLGFLRLYEATGDAGLLRKVQAAWDDTVRHHMAITGGVGVGEHYEPGRGEPMEGEVAETCATLSWLQVNQALLELTGDPKYAEVIERLLWNQVFASQAVEGDGHRYFTPPNGEKPRGQFRGPDCCNSSGHRMIALVPSVIYAEGSDGLFVNQFVPSSARLRPGGGPPVAIRQETDYPERDSVTIRVDPDHSARFALRLRIPAWCAGASAAINGVPCPAGDIRAGAYLALDRTWTAGDRVDLRLPMRVTWAPARGAAGGPAADRRWALTRGPVVFAVDTVLWDGPAPPPRSAGSDLAVVRDGARCCEPAPVPEGSLGPGLRIPVELADGSRVRARAWPFANVGAWFRPGGPRPDRDRAAFSYAVWLRSLAGSAALRSAAGSAGCAGCGERSAGASLRGAPAAPAAGRAEEATGLSPAPDPQRSAPRSEAERALPAASGASAPRSERSEPAVEQWGVAEVVLRGPSGGNPFTEVALSARVSRGDHALEVSGFYDGDGVYRIRFLPDRPGEWRYATRSNRPELDGQTGRIEVTRPSPGNHGPVRVRNTFHFAYADGTPYVPVGTTCYAWTHQGDPLEEQTLETLKHAPFNKLRMCVFPKFYAYNRGEPPLYPFAGTPPRTWDFSRFNPEFFRHLERRVGQLRDLGIEADLILLHPYDKGHWGFDRMAPAEDDRYLRYLVARLAAYRNVWWSLANEWDFLKEKSEADWDRMFRVVREADPYDHLRSIHNGTLLYNHTRPWVTHASIQNGSAVEDYGRAVLYRDVYRKPVVFDEVKYEGDIPERWGHLSAEELVHRFWQGAIAGTYVGHGETYRHPAEVLWWSKGGTLRGQSPPRIAFLRAILEGGPREGFEPIDKWQDRPVAGRAGELYLVYLGKAAPREWAVELPRAGLDGPMTLRAEVIDTWDMTISPLDGTFRLGPRDRYTYTCPDRPRIALPGKPYMAIRLRRIAEAAAP